jgi:hypothetical protein
VEGNTIVSGHVHDLSHHGKQVLFIASDAAGQHVGVTCRATYAEDREQKATLEHEAVAVGETVSLYRKRSRK